MEKRYETVEKVEEVQIPIYSFKASDLVDFEVNAGSGIATFNFGSEKVEITGSETELLSVKDLIDKAAEEAQKGW